jgi:hypothetical protein
VGSDGGVQLSVVARRALPGAALRAGLVAGVTALALLLLASPWKLCLVAAVLHVPCPGCGLTRAAFAIARGDVAGAIAWHPLSPLVVPVVLWISGAHAFRYVRTGDAWGDRRLSRGTEILLAAMAALLVAVWTARLFGWFGGPVPV